MSIDFMDLNYLAVLAGGIVYMAFGALYYSPLLFGKHAVSLKKNQGEKETKDALKYPGAALVGFLSSFLLALIVQVSGADDVVSGLVIGLVIGFLLALAYLKNTLFGLTSKKAYALAVSDHFIIFIILGILHAVWI
ncbi:DUF1761 domain-containing protein [Paenibacillus psychroresistens]|uniref:DUF1761 domain-containing protein n=1 Tax=Paenibacillus psychroresistens TaxID=1778678 RepID=A0A6B8RIC3_9BACL|nr:DUF1761 domain-containing protein [Paenibacillus psychroresistens]QGQ95637.1 DUF1761 domain-containing protein [Paenibacillus psychroresistens]